MDRFYVDPSQALKVSKSNDIMLITDHERCTDEKWKRFVTLLDRSKIHQARVDALIVIASPFDDNNIIGRIVLNHEECSAEEKGIVRDDEVQKEDVYKKDEVNELKATPEKTVGTEVVMPANKSSISRE
jgi:hypothetical protein